jgi:hypothetical protein
VSGSGGSGATGGSGAAPGSSGAGGGCACVAMDCGAGFHVVRPPGACCPSCESCLFVNCPFPPALCGPGEHLGAPPGECCTTCSPAPAGAGGSFGAGGATAGGSSSAGGTAGAVSFPACCSTDQECRAAPGARCVNTVCVLPPAGGCWLDDECANGERCEGAQVCGCAADCASVDHPGKCVSS